MQVPRITKITLNMGVGEAVADKKVMDNAAGDLDQDRRPEAGGHQARKAIALQDPRGCPSAARSRCAAPHVRVPGPPDHDRAAAHPRLPRRVGRAFDGRGNYNMGVKEQIIFPEIEYDKIDALRGMDISITTTAKTDDEGKALLEAFKFPFRN
jgi:large subunit ribosomal protein L5